MVEANTTSYHEGFDDENDVEEGWDEDDAWNQDEDYDQDEVKENEMEADDLKFG